jgi:hypothetical protein
VISCVALTVALSGTGYAVTNALPRNSVGPRQIRPNAINSAKVQNGTLLRVDFKKGQLLAGPRGPRGLQGPQGATGATGPAGPAGTTGQDATAAYGSAGLTAPAAFTVIPGLTKAVTVPTNAVVYVSTDGGIIGSASASGSVDIQMFVDGVALGPPSFRRFNLGTSEIANWSMANTLTLSAGPHTVDVRAGQVSGTAPTVSGNSGTVLQGQLSLVTLKR